MLNWLSRALAKRPQAGTKFPLIPFPPIFFPAYFRVFPPKSRDFPPMPIRLKMPRPKTCSTFPMPRNGTTTDGQELGGRWTFGDALPSCTRGVEFRVFSLHAIYLHSSHKKSTFSPGVLIEVKDRFTKSVIKGHQKLTQSQRLGPRFNMV